MSTENQFSPHKAVRTDVESIHTHLTQPTGLAADWAGMNYTNPDLHALVGFIGAFSVERAGS